jgi:Fe-S-cluster containining protein
VSDPLRNLRALRHKVDQHAQRVETTFAAHFACRRGCDGCCQTERSVSAVELAGVREGLDQLDEPTRARLGASTSHCSMLVDGACAVYAHRPLICRSHGLPLVMDEQLDVCPLNFEQLDIAELPLPEVLNVGSVTAVLVAVNALYCQEEGADPRARTELRDLLAQGS